MYYWKVSDSKEFRRDICKDVKVCRPYWKSGRKIKILREFHRDIYSDFCSDFCRDICRDICLAPG